MANEWINPPYLAWSELTDIVYIVISKGKTKEKFNVTAEFEAIAKLRNKTLKKLVQHAECDGELSEMIDKELMK